MTYEIIASNPRAKDLTGHTFGRLTAIAPIGRTNRRAVLWLCICECGTEKTAAAGNLVSGNTQSCGCLVRDVLLEQFENGSRVSPSKTHGGYGTTEYNSWRSMKERCNNQSYKRFHLWGGRGISICPEWNDFSVFLKDMGCKPSPQHSIDRIDNDGNYEPSNCRWATPKEQANNRQVNYPRQ